MGAKRKPRFGVVTSGGDSPGMNAAIEALVRISTTTEWEPYGVDGGFVGLREGKVSRLTESVVAGISGQAGTVLGSSRPQGLERPEALASLAEAFKAADLDALVILGGDGSIGYIGTRLQALGVPCVGIPCTIDNDVPHTEYTLGFESASQFGLVIIDAMRQTGRSLHGRLFLIETLGARTGHLALALAQAAQADAVAIPEVNRNWAPIAQRLSGAVERNGHALLVVSEGVAWDEDVEAALAVHLSHRVRRTQLGHAQRGGTVSYMDRVMGRLFAETALEAITHNRTGLMVAWDGRKVIEVPLTRMTGGKRPPDLGLYAAINALEGKVDSRSDEIETHQLRGPGLRHWRL